MAYAYKIIPEHNLLLKVPAGTVTSKQALELIDTFRADPAYRVGMMELDDLRRVEAVDISSYDFAQFGQLFSGMATRDGQVTKIVIVATKEIVMRHALILSEQASGTSHLKVGVYSSVEGALSSLRINDEAVRHAMDTLLGLVEAAISGT